eukprot:gene9828-7414_t
MGPREARDVAIHHDWWWQEKFAHRGFTLVSDVTDVVRKVAGRLPGGSTGPNYMRYSGMVFRNDRNVWAKPVGGPGTGFHAQRCTQSFRQLNGTRLLRVPWTVHCVELCEARYGRGVGRECADPGGKSADGCPGELPPKK